MTSVRLVHLDTIDALIAAVLAEIEPVQPGSDAVLLVSRTTPRSVEAAITTNRSNPGRAKVVRPSSLVGAFGRRIGRATTYEEIDVSSRAARLTTVSLPAVMGSGATVFVVNDLRAVTDTRPIVAIGLWSTLVNPWQRIGARVSDPRDGLVAEIALAAPLATYFIIDRIAGKLIGILGSDMVAVELVSLALRTVGRGIGADTGPWEDPLIQHASDLQLGVTIPEEITIEATGMEFDSLHRAVKMAAGRIGVTRLSLL